MNTDLPVVQPGVCRPLRLLPGVGQQGVSFVRTRGDFCWGVPDVLQRFADAAEKAAAMKAAAPYAPDTEGDCQAWVRMADFSVHNKTPHLRGGGYGIWARITAAGKLDFDICRDTDPPAHAESVAARLHTPRCVAGAAGLRLADAATARRIMLDAAGRIKTSCAPKFLGTMMAGGRLRYRVGADSYGTAAFYNHIWAYWGAVVDGLLCLVGFPVWAGDECGGVEWGSDDKPIFYPGDVPPTVANLPGHPAAGDFAKAIQELMYGGTGEANVEAMWKKWGGGSGETVICRRAVAVSVGGVCSRLMRGDIDNRADLYAPRGGVYATAGGRLKLYAGDDAADVAVLGDWLPDEQQETGYLPYRTHSGMMGSPAMWVVYLALRAARWGNLLRLSFSHIANGTEHYEPALGTDVEMVIPHGGGGGGGGGGVVPDDPDNPPVVPQPTPVPYVPPIGNAVWWEAGQGFRRAAIRRIGAPSTVRYEFVFDVSERRITVRGKKQVDVSLTAHVDNGGLYTIAPPPAVLQMLYGFQPGSDSFTVVNTSDKKHEGAVWVPADPPQQQHTCTRAAWREWVAKPSYGQLTVTSDSRPPVSDLYRCSATGRMKQVTARVTDPRTGLSSIWQGYLPIWRVDLVPAAVVHAVAAAAERGLPGAGGASCKPPAVQGVSASIAGAPVVKPVGVLVQMPHGFTPDSYRPAGGLFLAAAVTYSGGVVKYPVGGALEPWSEITWGNRVTAEIKGEMEVTLDAVRAYHQCSAP